MKEFAEALIGKLSEALVVLAPGALLLVASVAVWLHETDIPALVRSSDSLFLILGGLLALVVGVVLQSWSSQGVSFNCMCGNLPHVGWGSHGVGGQVLKS
jgi:hypothetical protein